MSYVFSIEIPEITDKNKIAVYRLSFDCGMFYIGSSINLKKRINQYRHNLSKRRDINKKLKAALMSHNSAKIEIIEVCCDEKEVRLREHFHIQENWGNPALLNRSKSAFSNRTQVFSEDERYALGSAMRGKKLTDEQRVLWSKVKKGIRHSDAHRKKISEAKKGVPLSNSHRMKLSEAKKGKPMPDHLKELRKNKTNIPVDKFDIKGNFISSYPSYTAAADSIGCKAGHIGEVVNGKYKSRSGFVFKKHHSDSENNK